MCFTSSANSTAQLAALLGHRGHQLVVTKCAATMSGAEAAFFGVPRTGEVLAMNRRVPRQCMLSCSAAFGRNRPSLMSPPVTFDDPLFSTSSLLAIDVDLAIKGEKVVEARMRFTTLRGAPKTISVDNGPEFVSKALESWAYENGVTLDFSRPGKPTDNAFVESFNGRLRDECLNGHWFLSLADARGKIKAWRRHYNESRPHISLCWLTPNEYVAAAALRAAE